jgi:hypothetical protein
MTDAIGQLLIEFAWIMNHSENSNQLHRACLIVARLSLIVSLWQAPVPWFHCHGTNLGQLSSVLSAFELSTHLAVFHPTFESNPGRELGWHLHWVLPSWSHALDDTPDDEPPAFERVAFDQATASSNGSSFDAHLVVDTVLSSSVKLEWMRASFAHQIPGVSRGRDSSHERATVLRC